VIAVDITALLNQIDTSECKKRFLACVPEWLFRYSYHKKLIAERKPGTSFTGSASGAQTLGLQATGIETASAGQKEH